MKKTVLMTIFFLVLCKVVFAVDIVALGSWITVDEPGVYPLNIEGSSSRITIADDNRISRMKLSGSENEIIIGTNVAIESVQITVRKFPESLRDKLTDVAVEMTRTAQRDAGSEQE